MVEHAHRLGVRHHERQPHVRGSRIEHQGRGPEDTVDVSRLAVVAAQRCEDLRICEIVLKALEVEAGAAGHAFDDCLALDVGAIVMTRVKERAVECVKSARRPRTCSDSGAIQTAHVSSGSSERWLTCVREKNRQLTLRFRSPDLPTASISFVILYTNGQLKS